MQGNSLIESFRGVDLSKLTYNKSSKKEKVEILLFDDESKQLKKALSQLLSLYYSCSDHNRKVQLRQEINNTINEQLESQFVDQNIVNELRQINHAENDRFFLWHTWFSDVFNREDGKNGFDIVIGNPPYIQLQNNGGELAALYENCNFETFARTGDIYCLFYEKGWQVLRPNGHLCFITSNKWMRAGYGEKTRGFFAAKTNPKYLIDFAGVKIFENATVDTNILIFAKESNEHKTSCAVTDKLNKESVKELSVFVEQNKTVCDFANSDSWVILSPIEQSIKRKIEAAGTPLKDWDINIYRGVLTGYNEAFIINTEKRNEILANCQTEEERRKTEELIRPILRGRDIKRYGYDWANLWLIATFPSRHYDIEEYPAVKDHLLSFGMERLEQTGKQHIVNGEKIKARKKTNNKWFETQDSISYWEDFEKPRITYREIGVEMDACQVEKGWMINNKLYMISGCNLTHLLNYFNSRLFNKVILSGANLTGGKGVDFIERIAVPLPAECDLTTTDNDTTPQRLYAFYQLTEEEIKFIENQ
ncbi:MAG: class I SAM-dependent DNA methyltransferase [Bacteroidales bacterium]|nr:class I SAM-dependent DNA methyltransferase [Bacteroidales bacterium]